MLYHREVGFPSGAEWPIGKVRLAYSRHARWAAKNDRYGLIERPKEVDLTLCSPVELETDTNGTSIKFVYRIPYSEEYDLVAVLIHIDLIPNTMFVKTIWLNSMTLSCVSPATYERFRRRRRIPRMWALPHAPRRPNGSDSIRCPRNDFWTSRAYHLNRRILQMKIVASNYKGKWFVLEDEGSEDDWSYPAHVDVDYYLTDEGLTEHVEKCRYYGIPAYIGADGSLLARIKKIDETLREGEEESLTFHA